MLFFRRILGLFSQIIYPSFGHCYRCGKTWNIAPEKSIYYSGNRGHFACCEKCYSEMTMEQKIKYYTKSPHHTSSDKKEMTQNILKEYNYDKVRYYREKKLKRILK